MVSREALMLAVGGEAGASGHDMRRVGKVHPVFAEYFLVDSVSTGDLFMYRCGKCSMRSYSRSLNWSATGLPSCSSEVVRSVMES